MKKSLFLAAFAGLLMASCAKNYSCVCTDKLNGAQVGQDTYPIRSTKKQATEACDLFEESSTTLGVTSETTCELK